MYLTVLSLVFLIAPALVVGLVSLAAGGAQAISGGVKKSKARKMARENIRPEYNTPSEITDTMRLLESRANRGLSDPALTALTESNQMAYANSVASILKGGGQSTDVIGAQREYNTQQNRVLLADEQQRINNFNQMLKFRQLVAEYKDKEYQINQYAPYVDKAAAAAQLASVGEQQVWQGVGTATQGISGMINSMGVRKDTAMINNGTMGTYSSAKNRSKSELAQQINWGELSPKNQQLLMDLINN